jgi:hypothetical protein
MVWVELLVALVINIVAYLIQPKPKTPKPAAAQDLDDPVAEAGRPIPVVFGTVTVKGGNILWFGNKSIRTQKIRV